MLVQPTVEDKMDAIIIPSVLAVLLFMMFSIPLFLRKYVVSDTLFRLDNCDLMVGPSQLQRRLNEETRAWMRIDQTKVDKKVDVRWRVRLPFVFGSTCVRTKAYSIAYLSTYHRPFPFRYFLYPPLP
jgi:hypothetical protein